MSWHGSDEAELMVGVRELICKLICEPKAGCKFEWRKWPNVCVCINNEFDAKEVLKDVVGVFCNIWGA